MTMTINKVRNELKRMDPTLERDSETYDYALALLSSAVVGPSIEKIRKFSGLPKELLQDVSRSARKNKIWVGSKLMCNWGDKESGGITFWLDVAVVQGFLEKV